MSSRLCPWRGLSAALLALLLLAPLVVAQDSAVTNRHRRLLEVREQQVRLRLGKAELQRIEQLFDLGLASKAEVERAQAQLEMSQLAYQEAVLSLLSLQPRLAVQEAVKHQDSKGRKLLRLTVINLTPTFEDPQLEMLNNFEGADPIPEEMKTRDIRDIFISIQDSGGSSVPRGTTIALPFEQHIPELRYGQSTTIDFQLLRDVSNVLVATTYQGESREIDIQLQQEESDSVVQLSSTQLSQEGDLGSQVTYRLSLERSSVDVRSFELHVLNLPRQVGRTFVEPQTGARLSELNFPAGITRQELELRLFLPEHADDEVVMDEPLELWAVVADTTDSAMFSRKERLTPEEITGSGAGYLRLEVVPRGTGKIEVAAVSLFSEVRVGDSVSTSLAVRNTGTRRLDNVRLEADAPIGWQVELAPESIPSLELRSEQMIKLRITPPSEVTVGDYEVRIETVSYADNRRVPSEDKHYRISVKPRSNLLITGSLSLLLLLVVGIVVVGIVRLTRR